MSIPDLVIREIQARPVVAPLPRPIRTASGNVPDAPLLLIDVLTDAGITGRAYALYTAHPAFARTVRERHCA
jgi:mandelate racemase